MKTFKVSGTDSGIKLVRFLEKTLPRSGRSFIYKSLRKRRIKVNGKRVKDGGLCLNAGDVLELYISDEFFGDEDKTAAWEEAAGSVDIVYSDENIAVLNKPAGLPSQDMPGRAGYSLESEFRRYMQRIDGIDLNSAYVPSLCHRIDRNTSGLVIAAKNITAHSIIAEKIKRREIRKFYILKAEGELRMNDELISGYIVKAAQNRFRFVTKSIKNGKAAALRLNTLMLRRGSTVLEAELLNGRTHQIRAVMSYLGHPIIGDVKYGAKAVGGSYQELTAYKLIFEFESDAGLLNYLNGKSITLDIK
ncbi:MAG TPA: RluA family pseudouridine synthase [Candidatus Monoglobus merdigallinarum]|uniref:RNA pseudouridylate synthase n=1 Tax=Candidatus Monoglobus merdigallinarum TaxID=2838698 RepID=A0A9D1PQB6_9FIRM|nr:RluA family pseudouridine synthase [Candidatus Monoglobus merdigallinarum]